MGIEQYAYFSLSSLELSAAEIGDRIGLLPDEAVVRGRRQVEPPVPVAHSWKITCRKPRMTVAQQVGNVLGRVEPFAERIRALVDSADVEAGLQIVRYFNNAAGQDDLLGWHLDVDQLSLLSSMRAAIDADEYGMDG